MEQGKEQTKKTNLIGDLEFIRKLSASKILLIDDQRNMVKTLENMLVSICTFNRKTESIYRAYDGKEALKIILHLVEKEKQELDLIFLDWNMPAIPGIEVLRAVRKSKNHSIRSIPVIMITGEQRTKDIYDAIYEGADGYMLKPFFEKDLRQRMAPILRAHWSKLQPKRAKNKRSDVRYNAENLRMHVEARFENGIKVVCEVVDISLNGIRISMKKDQFNDKDFGDPSSPAKERFNATSIRFPTLNAKDVYQFVIKVATTMVIDVAEADQLHLALFFKYGLPDENTAELWKEWVTLARKKDMDYRSQSA